ncbi:hypothetical protein Tco_0989752 [Tanacetum coccineum]|uniref:Uncharacterized protein n=1 Tax=Tanacetum coccineum TaxID=301880 RepID=A0ABQ5EV47_9ASTR
MSGCLSFSSKEGERHVKYLKAPCGPEETMSNLKAPCSLWNKVKLGGGRAVERWWISRAVVVEQSSGGGVAGI